MRRAACSRSSVQLRTGPGGGSLPLGSTASGAANGVGAAVLPGVGFAGGVAGVGPEQAASSAAPAIRLSFEPQSMQRTINLLGQIMRHAFDGRQVFNACTGDAAHTAETLQQLRTFF